jgi:hypothetical protein|tara:strand:+ start:102 stop:638 length:537 start_codon:yes stop_codon:yes gene_type:complete
VQIDLFSIPIWIGNIDCSKIIIEHDEPVQTFGSEIGSTHKVNNNIHPESLSYLYQIISKNIEQSIGSSFELKLDHIWVNYYKGVDFQESHAHSGSEICFIIYKKIRESNTVFKNPNNITLGSYYVGKKRLQDIFGSQDFKPECRENQILIFPAFLEHYVKKTSDAITIAGNLFINIIG